MDYDWIHLTLIIIRSFPPNYDICKWVFLTALLRYNWYIQNAHMDLYVQIYHFGREQVPLKSLLYVHHFLTSACVLLLFLFVCFLVRTFSMRSTLLTHFSVHSTMLLTTAQCYSRFLELTLHYWSFMPVEQQLPISPCLQPLTPTIILSTSLIWLF